MKMSISSLQDFVVEGDGVVSGAVLVSKNETSGEVDTHPHSYFSEFLYQNFFGSFKPFLQGKYGIRNISYTILKQPSTPFTEKKIHHKADFRVFLKYISITKYVSRPLGDIYWLCPLT